MLRALWAWISSKHQVITVALWSVTEKMRNCEMTQIHPHKSSGAGWGWSLLFVWLLATTSVQIKKSSVWTSHLCSFFIVLVPPIICDFIINNKKNVSTSLTISPGNEIVIWMLASFEAPITGTGTWLSILASFATVSTIFNARMCTLALIGWLFYPLFLRSLLLHKTWPDADALLTFTFLLSSKPRANLSRFFLCIFQR